MDIRLFEEWICEKDKKIEHQDQKVLLIVNNRLTYPDVGGLKAIDLYFLPPNTTSITHSMH